MDSLDFLNLEHGSHTNRFHLLDQTHPRYNHMDSIGRPGTLATEQFANMFVDKDRYVNDDILFESIDFEAGAAAAAANSSGSTGSSGVSTGSGVANDTVGNTTRDTSEYQKSGSNNSHSDSSTNHSIESWRLFVNDTEPHGEGSPSSLSLPPSLMTPETIERVGAERVRATTTSPAALLLRSSFEGTTTAMEGKSRVSKDGSLSASGRRRRNPFYSPSSYVKKLMSKKRRITSEPKRGVVMGPMGRATLKKSSSFGVLPLRDRDPNIFSRDIFPLD